MIERWPTRPRDRDDVDSMNDGARRLDGAHGMTVIDESPRPFGGLGPVLLRMAKPV